MKSALLLSLCLFALGFSSCQSWQRGQFLHQLSTAVTSTEGRKDRAREALKELLQARAELLATATQTTQTQTSQNTPNAEASPQYLAQERYNQALLNFLRQGRALRHEGNWRQGSLTLEGDRGSPSYQLRFLTPQRANKALPLSALRELRLAEEIQLPEKSWGQAAITAGLGLPLIAEYDPAALGEQARFVPEEGLFKALTLIVDLDQAASTPETQVVEVRLLEALHQEQASLGPRQFPLQRNLSVTLPEVLRRGTIEGLGLQGLFKPYRGTEQRALFQLAQADPQRIPIIFSHGLNAEPDIWQRAINALLRDPVLREQFQPLYFAYPTGAPIASSAAMLREQFAQWRATIDPSGQALASRHALLVGHSMGGLISRMQVIESEDHFWNAFFTLPPEKLTGIPQKTLKRLQNQLYFEPSPKIDGVIFLAVPHQGSEIADLGIVDGILSLMRLPNHLLGSVDLGSEESLNWLNPKLSNFRGFGIDGVSQLQPEHPFFDALRATEMQVPHHSIIGICRPCEPLEASSDLVVPYPSAHLQSAQTEDLIPSWHNLTNLPETIEVLEALFHQYAKQLPDK